MCPKIIEIENSNKTDADEQVHLKRHLRWFKTNSLIHLFN